VKRTFLLVALLLAASSITRITTQTFTTGWDNFNEPLNSTKSDLNQERMKEPRSFSIAAIVDATC
jgi:hypothetical protein